MIPEWRKQLAKRPPMAAWWLKRHHCSDVVLGSGVLTGRATMVHTDGPGVSPSPRVAPATRVGVVAAHRAVNPTGTDRNRSPATIRRSL